MMMNEQRVEPIVKSDTEVEFGASTHLPFEDIEDLYIYLVVIALRAPTGPYRNLYIVVWWLIWGGFRGSRLRSSGLFEQSVLLYQTKCVRS